MSFAGAFRRDCCKLPAIPIRTKLLVILAMAFFCGFFSSLPQAHAQLIIATVNGDPITDLDLVQRMKLLKVLRQPASRDDAFQSLVDDQLQLQETAQYKIKPTDGQIGQQIVRTAKEMKIAPEVLFGDLQHSGVLESHFKEHFAAVLSFYSLADAYHKGVEASESRIRAELAKEGGKVASTEYKIRQIIFVIPTTASTPEAIKGRMETAEQLRTRFFDCASGLPLARGMDNVAVKEEITSNSSQLNPQLKDLFDKTSVGHLTPPQRTPDGIEMIALCNKTASNDDTALRSAISERLLTVEIEADAAKRLKELRARAIIVKK
jgi:peptidyl-prolyl cis-trans isomerase SurA